MSERHLSPRQKSIRLFWASGVLGSGLFLGTHAVGQHFIDQHRGEPPVEANGRPSTGQQIESVVGDIEIFEIMVAGVALALHGRRALNYGALPRLQTSYDRFRQKFSLTALPDMTTPDFFGVDAQKHANADKAAVSQLGDEAIFAAPSAIEDITSLMARGTDPACSIEEVGEIADTLRSLNNPTQQN